MLSRKIEYATLHPQTYHPYHHHHHHRHHQYISPYICLLSVAQLIEAFGAGTAAIVSPVSGFHFQGVDYKVPLNKKDPNAKSGELAQRLWDSLIDIQVCGLIFSLLLLPILSIPMSHSVFLLNMVLFSCFCVNVVFSTDARRFAIGLSLLINEIVSFQF